MDKEIDAHFQSNAECQAAHDALPTLSEAMEELRQSISGNAAYFEPVPLPFWKTILTTHPALEINLECQYAWLGWWLITWSYHMQEIDINISFMPD